MDRVPSLFCRILTTFGDKARRSSAFAAAAKGGNRIGRHRRHTNAIGTHPPLQPIRRAEMKQLANFCRDNGLPA